MKFDTALYEHLRILPRGRSAEIDRRLKLEEGEAVTYSHNGYFAIVGPAGGEGGRKLSLILRTSPDESLEGDTFADLPKIMSAEIKAETAGYLAQKMSLVEREGLLRAEVSYPGIGFNNIYYDFDEKEGDVDPAIGEGVVNITSKGIKFLLVYENDFRRDERITGPFFRDLKNIRKDDILGPLMVPRLIAWGTPQEYQLGVENLDLEAQVFEFPVQSLAAVAARIVRLGHIDKVAESVLEQEAVQFFLPKLLDECESDLPGDVTAHLKRIVLENAGTATANRKPKRI